MGKDSLIINKKGGVLQCEPTKANKEALTDMTNISTIVDIPPFDFCMFDLDAIANIANRLKKQPLNKFSVAIANESYSFLTVLNYLHKKTHKYIFRTSKKSISKVLHFGSTEKKDIQAVDKILDFLPELQPHEYPALFSEIKKGSGNIVELYLGEKFDTVINTVIQENAGHNSIKITKQIYLNYLSKLKRQQRGYALFLELLFQEQKKYLEENTFCIPIDRMPISKKRLSRIFTLSPTHSVNEIIRDGERLLTKIIGKDYRTQIKEVAKSITSNKERSIFQNKILASYTSPYFSNSSSFLEQKSANDPYSEVLHEKIKDL